MKDAYLDSLDPRNIEKQLQDLKRRVRALELKKVKVNSLDELTTDQGLLLKGEFRAGNEVEPGNGFTGVRMTEDGVNGYANDVLQAGLSSIDGKMTAGAGAAISDALGFGIHLPAGISAWQERLSYKFYDENGVVIGDLYDHSGQLVLENIQPGTALGASLLSRAGSGHNAVASIGAQRLNMSVPGAGVGVRLSSDGVGTITIGAGGDGGGSVIVGSQNTDNDFIVWGNSSNAVLTVDAGGNLVKIPTILDMGDVGMVRGGLQSLVDDELLTPFTPAASKGCLFVYNTQVNENAIVIYNTDGPTLNAVVIGTGVAINNIALIDGAGSTAAHGADGKLNISCYSDGKIYIKNRCGGTRIVRWNLFGGV